MFTGILLLMVSHLLPAVSSSTASSDLLSDIDSARILTKKAVGYEGSGMDELALSEYMSAVHVYPRYAEAWSGMGLVLSHLGRYREALTALDQAVVLDPHDSMAWYYRGVVLQRLQRFDEAKMNLDESLRISPNNSHTLGILGEVQLSLGDDEGSLKSFTSAVSVDPSDGSAFAGLGEALYRINNLQEAKNSTMMAFDLYPDNLRAWRVMAEISQAEGKDDWSSYYRQTADDIARYGFTMPVYAKAMALQRLFEYERALPAYDSAIRQYPKESVIWEGRGEVLKSLGRFEESLRSYDQAVLLNPQNEALRMQRDMIQGLNR